MTSWQPSMVSIYLHTYLLHLTGAGELAFLPSSWWWWRSGRRIPVMLIGSSSLCDNAASSKSSSCRQQSRPYVSRNARASDPVAAMMVFRMWSDVGKGVRDSVLFASSLLVHLSCLPCDNVLAHYLGQPKT